MSGNGRGFGNAGQRLILLLKDENPRAGPAAADVHVFAGRKIRVAAGFQAMLFLIQHDACGPIQKINKILVGAGIAASLPVAFKGNEQLREVGAHGG